ncbi:MAG: SIMPL domain-containing protein [Quinella sp. 1Q7]|nr:SIMPL domain-containing protein [Quinella sp. 1Q7]
MKIFSLTFLIIMMICATTFAGELPPIISVSGEGVVEAQPDRATISVGVITREKNPAAVQAANAKAASSVINSIVALGIERKNISTGNYNFNPGAVYVRKRRICRVLPQCG